MKRQKVNVRFLKNGELTWTNGQGHENRQRVGMGQGFDNVIVEASEEDGSAPLTVDIYDPVAKESVFGIKRQDIEIRATDKMSQSDKVRVYLDDKIARVGKDGRLNLVGLSSFIRAQSHIVNKIVGEYESNGTLMRLPGGHAHLVLAVAPKFQAKATAYILKANGHWSSEKFEVDVPVDLLGHDIQPMLETEAKRQFFGFVGIYKVFVEGL